MADKEVITEWGTSPSGLGLLVGKHASGALSCLVIACCAPPVSIQLWGATEHSASHGSYPVESERVVQRAALGMQLVH